jgi:hypothetical protein
MTYTYTWTNAEKTQLHRDDGWFIPAEDGNRFYAEFLASGATAADYVAPPVPAEPTAEQKLAASGLTLDDFVEVIENVLNG